MVAEGVLGVLDRDREHAPARQLVEQRAAARRPPQAIAQRPRQPAQHARVDEELAQVLRQPGQHVLGEVLAQQPAAHLGAAEDPPPLVGGPAARREVEQLEAGRPALGPAGEHREVARRHRVVVDVAEQLLDLPGAEPQVVRPELEQLAGHAQAGKVDRGRHAAGDDDRQPLRGVVDEAAERGLGGGPLERVAVVDDERRGGLGSARRAPSRRPRCSSSRRAGPAARDRSAASRWRTNDASSASHVSARYQPTGTVAWAANRARSVVLPDPAGATTSVRRCRHASRSRASSRSRGRASGDGTRIFAGTTSGTATRAARCPSRAGRCPSRNRRPPPSSPPSAGPDYPAPRCRTGPPRPADSGPIRWSLITSSRPGRSMRRRRRTRRSAHRSPRRRSRSSSRRCRGSAR